MRPVVRQIIAGDRWRPTLARLKAQTAALGGIPGNSGTTPTITLSASGAAKSLTGSLVPMTDARFRYLGGSAISAGASFPNDGYWKWENVTYVPPASSRACVGGAVQFKMTGSVFEFYTKGTDANYRLLIDGLYDPNGVQTHLPNDGSTRFVKVDFGSSATREITIEHQGTLFFGGVVQNTGETLSAPTSDVGMRIVFLGDSFIESTGATFQADGLAFKCGLLLGSKDNWSSGSGGTGWVQTNGSRVALPNRYVYDGIAPRPQVVVVAMGLNDEGDGNDALVNALARQTIAKLRTALPQALIVVVGPWDPGAPAAPSSNRVAIRNQLQDACRGYHGVYFIDMLGVEFSKADATHPDDAGHLTLGTYLKNQIAAI